MTGLADISQQLTVLPERLAWHILLSLTALAAGIVISIPLAILCLRVRPLRGAVLAAASMIQTVPSLAMLALMVVIFASIGFVPAIVALVLYSVLPILRNTVTGIHGVDRFVVEAARGVGMTERQVLFRIQFPLAAPVIIAGIRTAAVWVCGIATLSTPVGQTSLGNYIFEGLQLRNNTAVTIGVVAAAALAIGLDLLIRLAEYASERRSGKLLVTAGASLVLLFGVGVTPLMKPTADVVVGAKTFTEQYVLAEVLVQRLRDDGFSVRQTPGMGSSILFNALTNGSVDCYVDYSGTIWANVMKRTDRVPSDQMIDEITRYLKDKHGVVCVGTVGFENTYALAMRRDRAEQLGIKTIEDLAQHARGMKLAGDYEFFGRPEWTDLRDAYALHAVQTMGMDSTLMYSAIAQGQVDVVAAFSTDGRIAAHDLVVLEDSKKVFPPYQAMVLVSRAAAERRGLIDALKPLVQRIDVEAMRNANKQVDVDGLAPRDAARNLLSPAPAAADDKLSPR